MPEIYHGWDNGGEFLVVMSTRRLGIFELFTGYELQVNN